MSQEAKELRMQKACNMATALELRNRLFDLANSFAGDETGHIACLLHESCNCILQASMSWNRIKGPAQCWHRGCETHAIADSDFCADHQGRTYQDDVPGLGQ
jgi:hypothetical protein